MNREFLINIVFLIFINLLIKPFFIFGIDLTVQNRVPDGDYGLYFTLFNFTYLFQILNDFGIQNFNNRTLSQHPRLLPKYFPNLLVIKCLLGVAYFFLTAFAAWFLAGYGLRAMGVLAILLVNQILSQFIFFYRSNISGLGFFRTDSALSSLDKLLMLATCGAALWAEPFSSAFSIEMFALAQTLALVITLAAAIFTFRKIGGGGVFQKNKIPSPGEKLWRLKGGTAFKTALVLFKKSTPYALVILLMTAYTRLDSVILERMLPDGKLHADVYAGGYRLLDACNMLGYLFATLLLPMFARLLKESSGGGAVRPLVSMSFKMIWAGSLTIVAAIFFARQDLVQLMMPERASAYRWETLGILIWAFVPVSVTYIFSTLLTANESLMKMNRFFIGGLALDLALNLLLIPDYQAIGSALATLGTQAFIAGAMVWLCFRTFRFRPSPGGLFQVFGFAAFVLVADFWVFNLLDFDWKLKFLAALAAGLLGVLLFKMVDLKKVLALRN